MLFYRAALPLAQQTLIFTSRLIRTHRRDIGSRWRVLDPGQQALLVLVYLRKGEPFAEVGAGSGVDHDMLALCQRNRRTASPPRTEAADGPTGGHAAGRGLRDHRRHADPRSTGSPLTGRSTPASTRCTG
jgi:hypothetical protein